MRIITTLMARAKPREPVPFQDILPLKLKATVSGKGNKTSEVCCIYEMSVLFACLSDNEFQQNPCGKEIEAFQSCYKSHVNDKKQREERELKGVITPGDKNLTSKQLNKFLKRYPNF